jgi:hypothetical protein
LLLLSLLLLLLLLLLLPLLATPAQTPLTGFCPLLSARPLR